MAGENLAIDAALKGSVRLQGEVVAAATAGTTGQIRVYFRDENNMIMLAKGTDVPADDTAGYMKGALYVDENVAAGTTGLYVNVGTNAAANFDAVSDA